MAERKVSRFYLLTVLLISLFTCRVLYAAEISPEFLPPPVPETDNTQPETPDTPSFPDDSLSDGSPLSFAAASPGPDMPPDMTPPTGSVSGPMWTMQPDYSLNVNFSDDSGPAVWMRYTTDNQTWQWNGWQDYSDHIDIHEDHPLGTNLRIWVQACDASWNCSSSETMVHYGSMAAPTGSVNGPMYTLGSGPLDIALNFTDADTQPKWMRYSTDFRQTSNLNWSGFVTYSDHYSINESRPLGSDLPILVQVCDESWNCSTAETSVHFGSMSAPRGYISYPDAYATGNGNVTLNVDFQDYDSLSMVMRYSTNVATGSPTWSSFQSYATTISVPLSGTQGTSQRVWVQVCDESWNCDSAETSIFFGPMPDFLNPLL